MKLWVVSNRLPIFAHQKRGQLEIRPSVGGVATGVQAALNSLDRLRMKFSDYGWIGWPGLSEEDLKGRDINPLLEKLKLRGVPLSEKILDKYYSGFCNRTIWPLFHFFPSYVQLDEEFWNHYVEANRRFCDALLQVVGADDVLWIQDYHLMLLPGMIRERLPDATVGFFLHIPFPSFEIFRLLPARWRSGILEGLLGADLIGFHTHDYTQAFLRCVLRILGLEHHLGRISFRHRLVKADSFPLGIDFAAYENAIQDPKVVETGKRLQAALHGARAILSVDRLDYTKGILTRLQGYEHFLKTQPQRRKKVVLILILAPSRTRVELYLRMKRDVDECVGRINGEYGSPDWTPVIYQYHSLGFVELAAYYWICDIALVTPLRDGMNLIAKEYLASRTEGTGVLILSEMAGAARELGEAVVVNPNTPQEIAEALNVAIEMPLEEQERRNRKLRDRLRKYDVIHWADDFLTSLSTIKAEQERLNARLIGEATQRGMIQAYQEAKSRLLFLDYDGTLVGFSNDPSQVTPGESLVKLLRRFGSDPRNSLVLVSGRGKADMAQWFSGLDAHLVAEHGAWLRPPNGTWKLLQPLQNDWKAQLVGVLRSYADRVPGAWVEEKEFSIGWHFRSADPELALARQRELLDDLADLTGNIDVQVVAGNRIVELRNAGVTKGAAALHLLSRHSYDFILAVGDDATDEDLFRVLPPEAYSIRVGITETHARFNLRDHEEVVQFLTHLTA